MARANGSISWGAGAIWLMAREYARRSAAASRADVEPGRVSGKLCPMRALVLLYSLSLTVACTETRLPQPSGSGPEITEASVEGTPPPSDESAVGDGNPFRTAINNPDEDGGPAAAATPADGRIGTTIATLGDASEGGFWLKTPLVTEPTPGRVVYVSSGRSVQVELRPLDGPAGGGSQLSMQAMRLLEAPFTGFPELVVYKG